MHGRLGSSIAGEKYRDCALMQKYEARSLAGLGWIRFTGFQVEPGMTRFIVAGLAPPDE
jgi:hypothetical protein